MGRAAARLFVVQSALSRQIKALEREIGGPLFNRTARGVTLTAVGEAFLPLARQTLDLAAEALRVARAGAGEGTTPLRVAPPDVGPWTRRIAHGLASFRELHPHVRIEVVAIPWTEHCVAIREDRIDVGFAVATDVTDHPPGIVAEVLARERLRTALLPATHPLSGRGVVSLSDLAGLPMVLSERDSIGVLHDAILEAIQRAGCQTPPVLTAPGSFSAVTQLVAGGAGWAAVLDLVRESPPPGTAARGIQGLDAELELHLLRRERTSSPALDALIEALLR